MTTLHATPSLKTGLPVKRFVQAQPGHRVAASLMAKLDTVSLAPSSDHPLLASTPRIIEDDRRPRRQTIPKHVERRLARSLDSRLVRRRPIHDEQLDALHRRHQTFVVPAAHERGTGHRRPLLQVLSSDCPSSKGRPSGVVVETVNVPIDSVLGQSSRSKYGGVSAAALDYHPPLVDHDVARDRKDRCRPHARAGPRQIWTRQGCEGLERPSVRNIGSDIAKPSHCIARPQKSHSTTIGCSNLAGGI